MVPLSYRGGSFKRSKTREDDKRRDQAKTHQDHARRRVRGRGRGIGSTSVRSGGGNSVGVLVEVVGVVEVVRVVGERGARACVSSVVGQ